MQECRELHLRVLQQVVKLASLQTAFAALDEVIKVTNRRVNALEYVVIPNVENIIHYIESEMSEAEREEFFRLKMMQKTKMRKAEEEEAANQLAEQMQNELEGTPGKEKTPPSAAPKTMLGDEDDDEIVV